MKPYDQWTSREIAERTYSTRRPQPNARHLRDPLETEADFPLRYRVWRLMAAAVFAAAIFAGSILLAAPEPFVSGPGMDVCKEKGC